MHTYVYYVSTLNETFEIKYKKAKNKPTKYHTVKTDPKFNGKIVETELQLIPLTHKYIIAHSPGFVHTLLLKLAG
jgi:hypothetical protein